VAVAAVDVDVVDGVDAVAMEVSWARHLRQDGGLTAVRLLGLQLGTHPQQSLVKKACEGMERRWGVEAIVDGTRDSSS